MRTTTRHELCADPTELLNHVEAGETIAIIDGSRVIAHLVPVSPETPPAASVDWTTSAAFTRDRTGERMLTAEEAAATLAENRGEW